MDDRRTVVFVVMKGISEEKDETENGWITF